MTTQENKQAELQLSLIIVDDNVYAKRLNGSYCNTIDNYII